MMKTAKEMFEELGLKQEKNNNSIRYVMESYSEKIVFTFDCNMRSYHVTFTRFIPKHNDWFEMMSTGRYKQGENMYSCKYGYWQSETIVDIGVREHKAIHQQMKELGWLDE